MNWRELMLVELISDLGLQLDFLVLLASLQLLAPFGTVGDVIFDQLVCRNVNHIVLQGQVTASSINSESLLVVDDHNSWLENGSEEVQSSLLTA